MIIGVLGLRCLLGQGNPASVSAPVLGYVYDTRGGELKPLLGIPGSSLMGQPLTLGAAVSEVAASERYALAITGQDRRVELLRFGQGAPAVSPVSAAASGPDRIFLSPSGGAAALYRSIDGFIQVITGLPDSPTVRSGITLPDLGGAVNALAISDDGLALLAALGNDQTGLLFSLAADGTPTQLPVAGPVSAMAFRPNSHDVAIADRAGNAISVIRNVDGSAEYQAVAGPNDGVAGPLAVEFSADGGRLFVANAGPGNVLVIDPAGGPPAPVPCQCALTALSRLNGSIFRLNDLSNDPLMLFDGGSAQPRVVFVPSDSQRSGQ